MLLPPLHLACFGRGAARVARHSPLGAVVCFAAANIAACSSASAPSPDDGRPPYKVVSANGSASTDEHEPTVAVTEGGRVLVAWIAAVGVRASGRPRRVIQYRVSEDRGTTFGPTGSIVVAEDENGGDPWAAAGPGEALYLASGGARRDAGDVLKNVRLFLSVSAASGAPFTTTEVTPVDGDEVRDQPRVEVVGDRVIYSYWGAGRSAAGRVGRVVSGRVDRWSSLPSDGNVRVCRGSGGPLYALVSELSSGVTLYRSDSGGDAWRVSVVMSRDPGVAAPGGCVAGAAGIHVVVAAEAERGSARGGALSFVDGTTEKIAWRAELPAGSWLSDVGVLDGRASVFGYLEAGNGEGALGRRIVGPTGAIELSWAEVGPKMMVSDALVDGESSRFAPPWPGDYLGVVTAAGRHWVAFTENHDGVAHAAVVSLGP